MTIYDALPEWLRHFYANYGGTSDQMKKAHMAEHFDDPVEPILRNQVDFLLNVYERLINATIDRRPTEGRQPKSGCPPELYHRILTYPDGPIFRDTRPS